MLNWKKSFLLLGIKFRGHGGSKTITGYMDGLSNQEKLITTDANISNSTTNQSEFEANRINQRQRREHACNQVMVGLASHWLRKSREFCQPITERCKANLQCKRIITFNTQFENHSKGRDNVNTVINQHAR